MGRLGWAALLLGAAGMTGQMVQAQTSADRPHEGGATANLEQLERQATQLADIEAVKRLQRAYGYYLDRSDWDNIVDLLTDDATLEYGPAGVFVGKAHARELLYAIGYGKRGLQPQQLREHVQMQPVITIAPDGQSAKGRWRAIVLLGQYHQYARWQTGPYENEYRKDHGVWKISRIHWVETFTVPEQGGWKTKMTQSNVADRKLPAPDRPSSFVYSPWPAVSLPPYHYAGPEAIRPLNPAPVAAEKLSAAAAAERIAHLKWQVDRLEDQRQIEILQRTYGYYVDKNLWQQIADLYTEDGTLEIGGRGVFVGRARILQYLQFLGKPEDGRLYDHTQLQPIVDVSPDGTQAKGRWRALIFTGGLNDGSVIGDAVYENEYRKVNGVWRIHKLHAYFVMYSTLEQGWAQYARPNTRPEKALPPDRPPTVVYDMYPGTLVAPLHYENPVTGKPVYPRQPVAAAPQSAATDQAAELTALSRTLTRLQDTQEIQNLQNAYGFYLDKWQWDSATALFADQGTLELAQRGVYVGRAHIRASLEDAFGPQGLHQGEVSDHAFYQPVIHIADDGHTAFARIRELSFLGKYGVNAYIAGGTRENQYVKENGVWRIKSDHLYLTFLADYEKGGWAHGALPAPGPSRTLPPDRPPSVNYKPFPAFEELPFHYPNPVTGKPVPTSQNH
ncbi:MAG TPA: nuclear transport factor 2 family protein [Steroidobacteraceae bacterium]|nr:nuclear transport factor 2 family protein [Steroidobacteraceae bacterium]